MLGVGVARQVGVGFRSDRSSQTGSQKARNLTRAFTPRLTLSPTLILIKPVHLDIRSPNLELQNRV